MTQASVDARSATRAGYDKVVDVLVLTGRSVERGIVAELEECAPLVAEEIKKRLFVFEDIDMLDGASMSSVVKAAAPNTRAVPLKAVEPQLRNGSSLWTTALRRRGCELLNTRRWAACACAWSR